MTRAATGRRLRGALVGYGFIGAEGHVPAYLQRADVALVAVADVCAPRRALVGARLPRAAVYASFDELLAAEGRRLDFVDVATPPSDHAAVAHRALDRGLHVLCEKPLAMGAASARELLAHAAAARRVLFPVHNYRHAPVVKAIGEVIRSGRIGRVNAVTIDTFRTTHARGVPEWNPDWRRRARWSGGGIAMDHGSHALYLSFEWMQGWPTAVTAKTANSDPARWDTEDSFTAALSFPGGLARVHLTWTAGVRKVIYCVQGERGAITVDDDELEVTARRPGGAGAPSWEVERRTISSDWMDPSHTRWFNALFDGFRAAIERGDHLGREVQDAYRCAEIVEEAYASAADGCRERPLPSALPGGGPQAAGRGAPAGAPVSAELQPSAEAG